MELWIKSVFLLMMLIGLILLIVPLLRSWSIRLRVSPIRSRRKDYFRLFWETQKEKINQNPKNYKLADRLKMAGHPFHLDVFRFRLLEILLPISVAFFLSLVYMLRVLEGRAEAFPLLPILFLMVAFYIFPSLWLRLMAYYRKKVLTDEIIKFSHRIVVGLNDQVPLFYAIRRAARTTKELSPYVDELLVNWLKDPKEAIIHFGDRVGLYEIMPLVNTLLASWNAPGDKIVTLFKDQLRNIDTMRDYQIKKEIEMAPLKVSILILIPFFTIAGLMLVPWYQYLMDLLRQIF